MELSYSSDGSYGSFLSCACMGIHFTKFADACRVEDWFWGGIICSRMVAGVE